MFCRLFSGVQKQKSKVLNSNSSLSYDLSDRLCIDPTLLIFSALFYRTICLIFFMFFNRIFIRLFVPRLFLSRFYFFFHTDFITSMKTFDFQCNYHLNAIPMTHIHWPHSIEWNILAALEIWLINWNSCCSTSWCLTFLFFFRKIEFRSNVYV